MRKQKTVTLPTFNVSLGEALTIVKYHLDNENYATEAKTLAIAKVAEMETHNSITKDELVNALRWMFATYDF